MNKDERFEEEGADESSQSTVTRNELQKISRHLIPPSHRTTPWKAKEVSENYSYITPKVRAIGAGSFQVDTFAIYAFDLGMEPW